MRQVNKVIGIATLILFISTLAYNQVDTVGKVRYSNEYVFKEGLFLSFDQVLNNTPLSFERIITGNKNADNWLENVLGSKTITILDEFGIQQNIDVDKIWGYSKNKSLNVNWDKDFYRIPYIGRISHYVATQTIRTDYYPDPYYGYSPGMGPSYETNKVVQNIIDFETGKSFPYSLDVIQSFLMKDPVLFDEFNQLKKNKKRQLMFLYIRKFNERNPLYLPAP